MSNSQPLQSQQRPPSEPQSPALTDTERDSILPPAKRQRVSPLPTNNYSPSPQTPFTNSPSYPNVTLPNGIFNSRPQQNGAQSPQTPYTPGSRPLQGVMGPPQRPAERPPPTPAQGQATTSNQSQRNDQPEPEKRMDINQLQDLMTTSGVNLQEEENYLYSSYQHNRDNQSFRSDPNQTTSPQSSFDLLSRGNFGNLGATHGSFQQQRHEKSQEEEINEKHRQAAREQNERRQYHLEEPFLYGNSIRKFMEKAANDNGVYMPVEGLWDRVSDKPSTTSSTSASGGGASTQITKAPSILNRSAPLEPMITLISLATNERIRNLLEDAYGLARGRQLGSDGIVPPDWADLAEGTDAEKTNAVPQSISGTAWDKVDAAGASNAASQQNHLPSPPNSTDSPSQTNEAQPTIKFPKTNSLTTALATMAQQERKAEEARLKLRAARRNKKAEKAAKDAAESARSMLAGTPDPTEAKAPAAPVEKTPEVKPLKKDQRTAKDITDEASTREANRTVALQLGAKKYSWMTGGNKASSPAPRPSVGAGTANKGSTPGTPSQRKDKDGLAGIKDRKFGKWREDGVGGRGVQLRDWIGVLEMDGKDKKTLSNAYVKLDGEKIAEEQEQG